MWSIDQFEHLRSITHMDVLIDTGDTANIMDKEAYKKIFPEKQKLKKAKSVMQP